MTSSISQIKNPKIGWFRHAGDISTNARIRMHPNSPTAAASSCSAFAPNLVHSTHVLYGVDAFSLSRHLSCFHFTSIIHHFGFAFLRVLQIGFFPYFPSPPVTCKIGEMRKRDEGRMQSR